MNAKQHRNTLKLAIQIGVKTVAQYAQLISILNQIIKEAKK